MAEEKEMIDGCPAATQDIRVNLKNRQYAIDNANYGPMVPASVNSDFWEKKAAIFGVTVQEAKKARCKNCAAFIQTSEMRDCIKKGLDNTLIEAADNTMQAANLGFCNIFDFKCAGERTCDAWVTGGPIK